MPVSTLVSPFRRVRERLVAGVLTGGGRMTSGRSQREVLAGDPVFVGGKVS